MAGTPSEDAAIPAQVFVKPGLAERVARLKFGSICWLLSRDRCQLATFIGNKFAAVARLKLTA